MKKTINVDDTPQNRKRNSNDASASGSGHLYQILFACILILSCIIYGHNCVYVQQEKYEDVNIINNKMIMQFQLKYQSMPLQIKDFLKTSNRTMKYKKTPETYFIVHNKKGEDAFTALTEKINDYEFMRKFLLLKLNFPKMTSLRINMGKKKLNKLYYNNRKKMKNKPKTLMNYKLSKQYLKMFKFVTGLSIQEAEEEINKLLHIKYNKFINENKKQKEERRELLFAKLKKIVEHALVEQKKISIEDIEKEFTNSIKKIRKNLQYPLEEKDAEINKKDAEINKKDAEINKKDAEINKKDAEINKKDAEINKIKKEKDAEINKKDAEIKKLKKQLRKLKK